GSSDKEGTAVEDASPGYQGKRSLLASAEENAREEPSVEEVQSSNNTVSEGTVSPEEAVITPDDEAALLHFVCETERPEGEAAVSFKPIEEWLLGVYHSWCEISALMYTLIGTNMSMEMVQTSWSYRAGFGCHCRLCLTAASNTPALTLLLADITKHLAHVSTTSSLAAALVKMLGLKANVVVTPQDWQLHQLKVPEE
ncbi:unnamed protein product, partial [Leptidea sinapis]